MFDIISKQNRLDAINERKEKRERNYLHKVREVIKKEKIALKAAGVDKKILAHRPKNWELIEVFIKITTQHKKEKGSTKFVQYKTFCRQLDEHNKSLSHGSNKLSVSEKGYYNLKKAWRNNTLENFV